MEIDNKLLEKAIVFATEKHAGQTRKGDGRPYILHPMSVLVTVSKYKKSKNYHLLFIVSLFHDLVEDCGVTLQEIAENFGYKVASIVSELTSDKAKILEMGKANYLLDKMLKMSSYALVIKLSDRLDNLIDLFDMYDEKREKKIEETKHIVDGLLVGRKLTKTHKNLLKDIKKFLS